MLEIGISRHGEMNLESMVLSAAGENFQRLRSGFLLGMRVDRFSGANDRIVTKDTVGKQTSTYTASKKGFFLE